MSWGRRFKLLDKCAPKGVINMQNARGKFQNGMWELGGLKEGKVLTG